MEPLAIYALSPIVLSVLIPLLVRPVYLVLWSILLLINAKYAH